MRKKFEISDVVKWCIDTSYIDVITERTGELITQPFPDFPEIWLVKPYYSNELVLVSEDDLEHI